jgi:hypothetical protein
MADQRITQLNALAKGDVAATDVLPIVDIGASETKKVTAKDLVAAGIDLVDNGEIDLIKLDQSSVTKLGTTALADDAVTAAKLADNSSTAYTSTVPSTDNFEGRGYVNSTTKYVQVWDGSAFQQVVTPTAGLEDGAVTTAKLAANAVTTAKVDAAGLGTAALADDAVTTAKIADDAVTADQLATNSVTADAIIAGGVGSSEIATGGVATANLATGAVTGPKLAADSSTVVSGNAPSGSGDFEGQQWINVNTGLAYVWTGSAWQQVSAVQTITFSDSTPIAFAVTKPDNFTAQITTTLDTQVAASVFAGPATGGATTPTFRSLVDTDLPVATSSTNGAVQPGTGLDVTAGGVLNHSNTVAAGTYTKVTVDAEGHISLGAILEASDVPNLDASKITTGTFSSAFLASNSVTADQLADYGIAQVSETQPTPEFAGQWWINPSDRSAYIWVGTVSPTPNGYWLLVGYGSPTQLNLRFGGTYNATTNTVVSLNEYGTEAGLVIGQPVGSPNSQNNGVYLVVTTGGTGTTPAPAVSLAIGDWILSQGTGSNWTKVAVVSGASGTFNDYDILSDGTYFTPDMPGVSDVRDALVLLWGRTQVATTSQIGVVLESTEVLVDNTTGEMSIGTVDDGTY